MTRPDAKDHTGASVRPPCLASFELHPTYQTRERKNDKGLKNWKNSN